MTETAIDKTLMVQDACRHCGKPIEVYQWVVESTLHGLGGLNTTSCDSCIEAYEAEKHKKAMEYRWQNIIPKRYLNTDKKDPKFPMALWQQVRKADLSKGLILYGALDTGKTRLAVEWMKLSAWKYGHTFDYLACDTINGIVDNKETEVKMVRFEAPAVLLIQGLFDELDNDNKSTKWMKRLLMSRKRNNKITYATSFTNSGQFRMSGKDWWFTDRDRVCKIVETWQIQHLTGNAPKTTSRQVDYEDSNWHTIQ